MDAAEARVLEIGDLQYIKEAFPDRTTLLWTERRPPVFWVEQPSRGLTSSEYLDCTPENFIRSMRDVRAGRYDLVVAYLPLYSPWHPRYGLRSLIGDPLHPWRTLTRPFGVSWLRYVDCPVPLVVADFNDHFGIRRPSFFLLDKADVVFKRELPADRWHVLVGSAHPALPTLRIRSDRRWQKRLEKLRPIALPPPRVDTSSLWEGEFPEKTADIFFSGNTERNSWVRRAGLGAMQALSERGFRVDIPDGALPRPEFYRRMSRAWLAWSPSGFGWDCYRTTEAAQCLTVPVVNHPTIERYRPLLQGRHLIQYDLEDDGLVRAVEAALADKERLKQMALAAREHVRTHLTLRALASHIIETGLSFRKSGS
jgi:glycosyltransferase involved in cell wall biosynthesis